MPSSRSSETRRRVLQACTVLSLLFLLSGCVYLRLLRFKSQLKDFDSFVRVEQSQGLALEFLKPIVRDSDFVFLTESQPSAKRQISAEPSCEEWEWLFEKKLGDEGDAPCTLAFRTRFEEHLLTRVAFDPKLLEAIPGQFVVELFRSLGKAKINKLRRSATAKVNQDSLEGVPLPTMAEILQVMGPPSESDTANELRLWRYEFNFFNPENGDLAGQFRLVFKTDSDDLQQQIWGFEISGRAR